MTSLNITFHSRAEAKKLIDDGFLGEDTVFISLNDTQEEQQEMAYHSIGHVNRIFSQVFPDNDKAFTKDQATTLVCQIDDAYEEGLRRFVVHCWAGISRSGAVAKFINDYYGKGDDHPVLGNYKNYNKRVYSYLQSEYFRIKHGLTQSWEE